MCVETFLKRLGCNHLLNKPLQNICENICVPNIFYGTFIKYLKVKRFKNVVVTNILNTNILRDLLCSL